MPRLYKNESSHPKTDAQRNLCGRTHYVDNDTLRWHKSRILSSRNTDGGLLFAITTSDALDMNNSKRGYRYVVFDVFGNTIARPKLEESFKRHEQAIKAMWTVLNETNARDVTLAAIESAEKYHAMEMAELRAAIADPAEKAA